MFSKSNVTFMKHLLEASTFITILVALSQTTVGSKALFVAHPIATSFALLFVMSQSVTVYHASYGLARPKLRKIHFALGVTVIGLFSLGLYFMVRFKRAQGLKDFNAVHGKVGLALLCLTCLQALVGIRKYIFKTRNQGSIHLFHGRMGLALYELALITAGLGINFVIEEVDRKPIKTWRAAIVLLCCTGLVNLFYDFMVAGDPKSRERQLYLQAVASTSSADYVDIRDA